MVIPSTLSRQGKRKLLPPRRQNIFKFCVISRYKAADFGLDAGVFERTKPATLPSLPMI
jgi:hypothetical protein